jgi:hypothetical protein
MNSLICKKKYQQTKHQLTRQVVNGIEQQKPQQSKPDRNNVKGGTKSCRMRRRIFSKNFFYSAICPQPFAFFHDPFLFCLCNPANAAHHG